MHCFNVRRKSYFKRPWIASLQVQRDKGRKTIGPARLIFHQPCSSLFTLVFVFQPDPLLHSVQTVYVVSVSVTVVVSVCVLVSVCFLTDSVMLRACLCVCEFPLGHLTLPQFPFQLAEALWEGLWGHAVCVCCEGMLCVCVLWWLWQMHVLHPVHNTARCGFNATRFSCTAFQRSSCEAAILASLQDTNLWRLFVDLWCHTTTVLLNF